MSEAAAPKIGLALSGGGSRAIAFHLGCLRALNRLGLLDRVVVLSTVSGGSVIGAYFHAHRGDFASFEAKIRAAAGARTRGTDAPQAVQRARHQGRRRLRRGWSRRARRRLDQDVFKIVSLITPRSLATHFERFDIRSPLHRFASRTTLLEAALDDLLFKRASLE